jgi:SAM-dependent methyltransferase
MPAGPWRPQDRRTAKRLDAGTEEATMGTATINGDLWGARAQAWSEVQEGQCRPLFEAALTAIAPGPATHLLDAGCGAGMALQLAAARGATVTGIDASPALLAIAHHRVPDAELRTGELEELPYTDGTFDAATAFNSVQYAADPARALAELGRVVRPGGEIAVATWGQPEDCEITAVLGEVGPLLPPPPPGAPHEGPFALSPPGRLEAFVGAAGLTTVRAEEVSCPMVYPDLATALSGQVSSGVLVMAERHAGRDAVTDALHKALDPFVGVDGTVRLENTFRFVIARVG